MLVGVEYGLYAGEDITEPDKKIGIIYKKGELVDQGRISEEGTLDFTDLYLGEYVVKEREAPEGYLLDEAGYPVSLAYEGQEVKSVRKNVTVEEQVKKQESWYSSLACRMAGITQRNWRNRQDILTMGRSFGSKLLLPIRRKKNCGFPVKPGMPRRLRNL